MQTDKTKPQNQSATSQNSPAESPSQLPRKKESWGGLDIFRLYFIVGRYALYNNVDRLAAQCGALGDRNRIVLKRVC